jgi:alpha-tubulin suppressor-like RCC1 family protein
MAFFRDRVVPAWKFLTGKYPVNKTQTVYVESGKPENQFVQLIAWQDSILALDAQGKIWELRHERGYPWGFVNTLVQESPCPRSYV